MHKFNTKCKKYAWKWNQAFTWVFENWHLIISSYRLNKSATVILSIWHVTCDLNFDFSLLIFQVRTLFVSGLPMDAKPRELYLLFRGCKVSKSVHTDLPHMHPHIYSNLPTLTYPHIYSMHPHIYSSKNKHGFTVLSDPSVKWFKIKIYGILILKAKHSSSLELLHHSLDFLFTYLSQHSSHTLPSKYKDQSVPMTL